MLCHTILSDITDAYEWSFVAVPAQRNAGVTKQYGGSADHDRITVLQKQLQSQQAQLSAAEEDLRKELVTLCYLSGQPLQKSLLQAAERMTFPERWICGSSCETKCVPRAIRSYSQQKKKQKLLPAYSVSNEIMGVGTNEIGTGSMLFSDVDAAGGCTAL